MEKLERLEILAANENFEKMQLEDQCKAQKLRINELTSDLKIMKKKVEDAEKKATYKNQVYEDFGVIFTKNMIDLVVDGNYFKKWNDEDIAVALGIYNLSSSCYTYLREELGFPFPSTRCIMNWMSKIEVKPGIFGVELQISLRSSEQVHYALMKSTLIAEYHWI